MARNTTFIDAPPAQVFEVLADPGTYAEWVVGSRSIHSFDDEWPTEGTAFGHEVGLPPLVIRDRTIAISSAPPTHLVLEARARPLPSAHIAFKLEPRDGGTHVTMVENLADPVLNLLAGPFGHAVLRLRNRETLRRLKLVAERGRLSRARRG